MATLHLEIITIERRVLVDEVNMVIAPGVEGVMGILPRHAALLTALDFGELQIKKNGEPDRFFAISGGFMEVTPDQVVVLADAVEHVEEIDLARAEAARQRAEEFLAQRHEAAADFSQAQSALRRSVTRLKVARRHQKGGGYGMQSGPTSE